MASLAFFSHPRFVVKIFYPTKICLKIRNPVKNGMISTLVERLKFSENGCSVHPENIRWILLTFLLNRKFF